MISGERTEDLPAHDWLDWPDTMRESKEGYSIMYDIEMMTTTEEFFDCWRAAAMHLDGQETEHPLRWLKSELSPPYLEHLSFVLGNQAFYIHVVDVDGEVTGPGTMKGLQFIAEGCNGYCCVMPMKHSADGWKPVHPGWGLLNKEDMSPLSPPDLVTDEKIVMTDWEVHDSAVQFVCQILQQEGRNITTRQGSPDVDPAIWFEGDDGLEWVVVRAARYPNPEPKIPDNWDKLVERCSELSQVGNFACVRVTNPEDHTLPLWRGEEMNAWFEGMEKPSEG